MTRREALDAVDWYIRCLEDVQDKRPVRNLDEAKLASDRALELLREELHEEESTYEIIRFYRDENHPNHRRVVRTGLTLAEAQAHCQDDSTHELDDEGLVVWFDGFTKE